MKRTICILLALAAWPGSHAQEAWTLDGCIRYAVEHASDMRRGRIILEQGQHDVRTARLDFLPTVSAQVSGQYSWGRNVDPETNTYNTITTFNNYYSLGASVNLFDGGQTLNAFRRARNARAQAATALQKAGDDKAIAVMTKFVDAIYNQRSVALARQKLADSQALLHKTQRLFELGERSKPDVAQMESQVAEDDYRLLHQQNLSRLALLALKSEMNWPGEDTLVLAVPSEAAATGHLQDPPSPASLQAPGSPAVMLAERQVADARYAWLMAKGALMPSVALGAGIQTNYYRNLSQESGNVGGFGSQFHNNMGEYVYLSLSIPVFTPNRWRSARKAKSEWRKAQLDLDDARRRLRDDIAQATADRDGYRAEASQMERKVAADSLAYHLSVRKYEEGMLSTFDLHTAAQTLLDSRVRLLQTRLLLLVKERLVAYYHGSPLWQPSSPH